MLVAVSGGLVVLAVRQLHAALLMNLQHLEYQHASPVHWRSEKQQQHRCLMLVCVCVCVHSALMLSVGLIMHHGILF